MQMHVKNDYRKIKFIKRSFYFMKKFLSMALALVMVCNFTLLGSRNIAAAEGWVDYYDAETWKFVNCDDEYVAYKMPRETYEDMINNGTGRAKMFLENDVIVTFPKKDVKKIIEEKLSTFWKIAKSVLWAVYAGIIIVTSCGLYRIYNQHIYDMEKEGKFFTINENSTLFEGVDATAANYTKRFNELIDKKISPILFGNNSIFNRGFNGIKSFFINSFNAATQTVLNKIWTFGRKTNSSNTQQPTSSSSDTNIQQQTNSSVPIVTTATDSSTPIVPPTNSSNTKTQQQTQKPMETPNLTDDNDESNKENNDQ